jgi:membrane-bound ClpP family serine protease
MLSDTVLMPLSSFLLFLTLIVYGIQVHKGHNNPSIFHLSLCNFALFVNVPTYIYLSRNFWASVLAIISFLGSLLIFFIFLRKKEYHPLEKNEKNYLLCTVTSFCLFWFIFGNGVINIATHIIILFSSGKNSLKILEGKARERHLPCYLSISAYMIMGFCMLPKAGIYKLHKFNFSEIVNFTYIMSFPISRLVSSAMILFAIYTANKRGYLEQ